MQWTQYLNGIAIILLILQMNRSNDDDYASTPLQKAWYIAEHLTDFQDFYLSGKKLKKNTRRKKNNNKRHKQRSKKKNKMKWKYKNKRNSRNKYSAIGEIESEKNALKWKWQREKKRTIRWATIRSFLSLAVIYFTMYLLFNHLIYFHRLFVFKKLLRL